jgi:thioredoxin-like negative regulator of GroEL
MLGTNFLANVCGNLDVNVVNFLLSKHCKDTVTMQLFTNNDSASINNGPVILYFTGAWCQPCKNMKPMVNSTLEKYPEIKAFELDTATYEMFSNHYKVSALPTVVALKDGQVMAKQSGVINATMFNTWVKNSLVA